MKILFLNVCRGMQGQLLKNFFEKEKKTVDVFCLQETDETFGEMLSVFYEKYNIFDFCKPTKDGSDVSIKTMINKQYGVLEKTNLWPTEDKIGGGILLKTNDMCLGNIHGIPTYPDDKKDTEVRIKQSKDILEFTSGYATPKIIGGDFNININTESVRIFEKAGYRNLVKEYGIKTTRNKLAWEKWPGKEQMYADFVFVSPEVKVKSFEVLDIEVSDHLPMVLEIEGCAVPDV